MAISSGFFIRFNKTTYLLALFALWTTSRMISSKLRETHETYCPTNPGGPGKLTYLETCVLLILEERSPTSLQAFLLRPLRPRLPARHLRQLKSDFIARISTTLRTRSNLPNCSRRTNIARFSSWSWKRELLLSARFVIWNIAHSTHSLTHLPLIPRGPCKPGGLNLENDQANDEKTLYPGSPTAPCWPSTHFMQPSTISWSSSPNVQDSPSLPFLPSSPKASRRRSS